MKSLFLILLFVTVNVLALYLVFKGNNFEPDDLVNIFAGNSFSLYGISSIETINHQHTGLAVYSFDRQNNRILYQNDFIFYLIQSDSSYIGLRDGPNTTVIYNMKLNGKNYDFHTDVELYKSAKIIYPSLINWIRGNGNQYQYSIRNVKEIVKNSQTGEFYSERKIGTNVCHNQKCLSDLLEKWDFQSENFQMKLEMKTVFHGVRFEPDTETFEHLSQIIANSV